MKGMKEIQETSTIGDISIPDEIQRLEKMDINISNYHAVIDKFRTLLTNLDTVYKEKMEVHAKIMDDINDVVNSDEVAQNMDVLRQNIWYTKVVTPMRDAVAELYRAVGYLNQIVAIQKVMTRKEKELLDTHQEIFAKQMQQEGVQKVYGDAMKHMENNTDKLNSTLISINEASRKALNENITAIISGFLPLATGKQSPIVTPTSMQKPEVMAEKHREESDKKEDKDMNIESNPEIDEAVLKFLKQNPKVHNLTVLSKVSKELEIDSQKVKDSLKKLHNEGKVKRLGSGFGIAWSLE